MSHERPSDVEIERALRAAFEELLPELVAATQRRLTGSASSEAKQRSTRGQRDVIRAQLGELLDLATTDGGALDHRLSKTSLPELKRLARMLDRALAERSRSWPEDAIRQAVREELVLRATRGDVFRGEAERP